MHKPLVFIHGSGDNSQVWQSQIDYFGTAQAFAIDLPGHGSRSDSLPKEATVLDYTHAAHTIIKEELQLGSSIIAGHSLGGAIALTMALTYPSTVDGLILIGTGARLKVHPTLLEEAQHTPVQAKQHLTELAVASAHRSLLEQEERAKQQNTTTLYRDLAACNTFDIMNRLYEIAVPTLILCGDEDRLTPPKYSEYLRTHIQNSTMHSIPEAGHYVMWEQTALVNQAIEQWLQHTFTSGDEG